MAKQKVAKKAVELLENTVTGDYQPYQSRMWDRPRDLPLFSFFLARTMLWDSTIRLGLRMRSAALQACQFAYKADSTSDQWIPGVEASDEVVGDFVYRQVKRLWENDIDRLLEAQIWGWAAAEVNYRKTRYGQVELDRLVAINPADARILIKDGEETGVRFSRLGTVGEYDVAFPKAIFHSFNPPPGDPYGISILMGSISPWADKWLNGGALDVRRLFFVKDAYRGVTLTYPAGRTYSMPDGLTTLSAKELAQQIVEQLKTGGVYTMPYDPDPTSGKNMWELKEASVSANPAHILEYPKDLDTEILRGLEIPDDILTAEQSGAWQGKMVPMQAFYTGLETWLASLVRDVQRQIVEPLVKLNFGEGHWFEITTKPLATQAMEMQKPPQQQGQPGQPQGMANQDDYAEAFRMGLERAVGSGGVRLGLDAEGHEHKGKGKGGGQFTSGGGGTSGKELVAERQKQSNKDSFNPNQKRAAKGGEVGPNQEHYRAGAFIATTDMPKKVKAEIAKSASKKVVIEPGKFETLEPGSLSILNAIGGTYFNYRDGAVNEQYMEYQKLDESERDQVYKAAQLYRDGTRLADVSEFPLLAKYDDIARLMNAELPIPESLVEKARLAFGVNFERYKPNNQ